MLIGTALWLAVVTAPTSDFESLAQILARVAEYNAKRRPAEARQLNRHLLLALLAVVGIVALVVNLELIRQVIAGGTPADWDHYVIAGQRAWAGESIYRVTADAQFPYAPPLAYVMGGFATLGLTVWRGLHIAAAVALPRPLGIIVLLSFPFWWDVMAGSVLTFQLLAAAWAMRGRGWAIGSTLVLALLIPRPLTIPLMVWLLWANPEWRIRFVWIAVGLALLTLATGQAFDWLFAMRQQAADLTHFANLSPSRLIGVAWIPIGAVLAVILLRRRWVGLACLAASPYLLPYYLLLGFLGRPDREDDRPERRPARQMAGLSIDADCRLVRVRPG